jgi:hypothetical protein
MQGVITARHVLRHPAVVIRGFGWRVFGRCLVATLSLSRETFLSIVASAQ